MAFCARMRARWQRSTRYSSAQTLISSSQCTRWCIDHCADQLETFSLGEPNEQNFVEPQTQRPCQPQFPRSGASHSVSGKPSPLAVIFLWNVVRYCFEGLVWAAVTTAVFLLRGCRYSAALPSRLKPCRAKDVNRKKLWVRLGKHSSFHHSQ